MVWLKAVGFFRVMLMVAAVSLCGSALCAGEVIDVFLFGGQSNMEGVGITELIDAPLRDQPEIMLYHSSSMNSGQPAEQWTTLRPASSRPAWFGPELGFGEKMSELMPDARLAVIKHAVSGTSLAVDWATDAGSRGGGRGGNTFGPQLRTFLDTVGDGMEALRQQGLEPRIRGMFWQQGEADAKAQRTAEDYRQNMVKLIATVREELDAPQMLFVLGQVLTVDNETERAKYPFRDIVRAGQAAIDQNSGHADAVEGTFLVLADDLTTHGHKPEAGRPANDFTHFNTAGQLGLGQRYATRMHEGLTVPEPGTLSVLSIAGVLTMRRRSKLRR